MWVVWFGMFASFVCDYSPDELSEYAYDVRHLSGQETAHHPELLETVRAELDLEILLVCSHSAD